MPFYCFCGVVIKCKSPYNVNLHLNTKAHKKFEEENVVEAIFRSGHWVNIHTELTEKVKEPKCIYRSKIVETKETKQIPHILLSGRAIIEEITFTKEERNELLLPFHNLLKAVLAKHYRLILSKKRQEDMEKVQRRIEENKNQPLPDNLEKMTKAQLKDLLSSRGVRISNFNRCKKARVIELIRQNC